MENTAPVAKAFFVGGKSDKILDSPRNGGTEERENDSAGRLSSDGNVEIDFMGDLGTHFRGSDRRHDGEKQDKNSCLHR